MSEISKDDIDYLAPAELPDQDLYHPHSWITKYVFCQDAKVIAIQYSLTALAIGFVAQRRALLGTGGHGPRVGARGVREGGSR